MYQKEASYYQKKLFVVEYCCTSIILDICVLISYIHRVDEVAADKGPNEECCICMDQKAEVILACVHSFCKTCIDRW